MPDPNLIDISQQEPIVDESLGTIYRTHHPTHKEVTVQAAPNYATFEVQGATRKTQQDAFRYDELTDADWGQLTDTERSQREWSAMQSLSEGFIKENPVVNSGSTASVTTIRGNTLTTLTLGDADAFVLIFDAQGRIKGAKQLNSEVHTGKEQAEIARIGQEHVSKGRINGKLEVTRAIGDEGFRPHIISQPRVDMNRLDDLGVEEGDKVLLVQGCDGLGGASFQDTTSYIMHTLSSINDGRPGQAEPYELMHALADKAISARMQRDNLTVSAVVVKESGQSASHNGILGVFDGHGDAEINDNAGRKAALYMSKHITDEFKKFYNMTGDEYQETPFSTAKQEADYLRDSKPPASSPGYYHHPQGYFTKESNRNNILITPGQTETRANVSFWDEEKETIVNLVFDPEDDPKLQRQDGNPLSTKDIDKLGSGKLYVSPLNSTITLVDYVKNSKSLIKSEELLSEHFDSLKNPASQNAAQSVPQQIMEFAKGILTTILQKIDVFHLFTRTKHTEAVHDPSDGSATTAQTSTTDEQSSEAPTVTVSSTRNENLTISSEKQLYQQIMEFAKANPDLRIEFGNGLRLNLNSTMISGYKEPTLDDLFKLTFEDMSPISLRTGDSGPGLAEIIFKPTTGEFKLTGIGEGSKEDIERVLVFRDILNPGLAQLKSGAKVNEPSNVSATPAQTSATDAQSSEAPTVTVSSTRNENLTISSEKQLYQQIMEFAKANPDLRIEFGNGLRLNLHSSGGTMISGDKEPTLDDLLKLPLEEMSPISFRTGDSGPGLAEISFKPNSGEFKLTDAGEGNIDRVLAFKTMLNSGLSQLKSGATSNVSATSTQTSTVNSTVTRSAIKIDEVQQFFESNKSFFATPLKDQAAFQSYFKRKGTLEYLEDYSEKFIAVLKKTIHQTGNYKAPVFELWRRGNFAKALRHPEVRQFIMDNANHPAIRSWQEEHPPRRRVITDRSNNNSAALIKKRLSDLQNNSNKPTVLAEEKKAQKVIGDVINLIDAFEKTNGNNGNKTKATEELQALIRNDDIGVGQKCIALNNYIENNPSESFAQFLLDKLRKDIEEVSQILEEIDVKPMWDEDLKDQHLGGDLGARKSNKHAPPKIEVSQSIRYNKDEVFLLSQVSNVFQPPGKAVDIKQLFNGLFGRGNSPCTEINHNQDGSYDVTLKQTEHQTIRRSIKDGLVTLAYELAYDMNFDNVKVNVRFSNFKPGDDAHNQTQAVESIQYAFRDAESKQGFLDMLKNIDPKAVIYNGTAMQSGNPILQIKASFFTEENIGKMHELYEESKEHQSTRGLR